MTESDRPDDADSVHLQLALATSNVGVWELDTRTGVAWRNLRHDEIFGYSSLLPEWTYDKFLDHVIAKDRSRIDRCYSDAITNKHPWAFECRICRRDGQERWISVYGRPLWSPGGDVTKLIGHVIDITSTKHTEEHLRLVTAELNHRVRNMLATIKALIQESARNNNDVNSFAKAIEGRIAALSRTYDLLTIKGDNAIPIADILLPGLESFRGEHTRIYIQLTEHITLHRSTAEKLALIIHELITNAIKYGALSNNTGHVTISSRLLGNQRVQLVWRETGGPATTAPNRMGFGFMLLSKALGDEGLVKLDFKYTGLVCTIDVAIAGTSVTDNPPNELAQQVNTPSNNLAGKTILIVEDEPLIGISYRTFFSQLGANVIGPLTTCERALKALNDPANVIDTAILDVNLGKETSEAVAQSLMQANKPFIFTTGYEDDSGLANRYSNASVLTKPTTLEEIENRLKLVLAKMNDKPGIK